MAPEKSFAKYSHYRKVWLALLIVTTAVAVMGLGFSSRAVHMPGSKSPAKSNDAVTPKTSSSQKVIAPSRVDKPLLIDSAPNMTLEVLPGALPLAAPMPPPKANLDQIRNGTAAAPINPPNWVNGNAGASQAHYNEGHSIPYRVVLTDMALGPHTIEIEWDIRQGSKNALDYITHYNRLSPHLFIPAHAAETPNPTIGVAGLGAPTTFAIPAPNASSPTVATTSFNALPAAEREMTIYNGSITGLTYLSEGSLAVASSSTRMRINFNLTSATAVIAWGGHIASSSDWGPGSSASSVSGSPYHTRLLLLDGASTGQQDRSLSAGAVFIPPDCTITGAVEVCPASTNSYSGPSGSFTYLWTITEGTATISGSNTNQTVNVLANSTCGSYKLQLMLTRTADNGMSTCEKVVNVVDTTNPTVTFDPPDATISCPATPVFGTPTFADNCDGNLTVTSSDSSVAGCSTNTGAFTRTWTATDDCGNSVQTSQTITVIDTTAPAISNLPAPSTIECPATPSFATPTATDSCDSTPTLTFNDVTTPGSCANEYSVTRTWTATDDCGNSSQKSQTITVEDSTDPVISGVGGPQTIECPATPQFSSPTASDACDESPDLTYEDVRTDGACANEYSVTRTWTATDACGNSSNASQTITVEDNTDPVISGVGGPQTIECPATPQFSEPTASDACDSTPTLTFEDVRTDGACANEYSVTRTWTATDDCGNSSTASQTITVEDNTDPVISGVGGPQTIECPATPQFSDPTASDACDDTPTLTYEDVRTDGACANEYSVTRTWTATDNCGNSSTASQTITVEDNTKPVISCPADVTVTCLADVPPPDFDGGEASDACGSVTITHIGDETADPNSCGAECGGKIYRTYRATDACGNFEECTQIITYGTPGSGQTAQQELIASLLKSGDLVVGVAGSNSLTIPGGLNAKSSAFCLVTKLSASGTASSLVDFGDKRLDPATCQTSPSLELQKDGTWANAALSQAVSLALNLRLSEQHEKLREQAKLNGLAAVLQVGRADTHFDLSSFKLTAVLSTQGALAGSDGLRGTFDDELDVSSARTQYTIPASVLLALGPNGTAADLLKLANAKLADVSTSDAELSDIAAALDAVNRSFDFGKRRLVSDAKR